MRTLQEFKERKATHLRVQKGIAYLSTYEGKFNPDIYIVAPKIKDGVYEIDRFDERFRTDPTFTKSRGGILVPYLVLKERGKEAFDIEMDRADTLIENIFHGDFDPDRVRAYVTGYPSTGLSSRAIAKSVESEWISVKDRLPEDGGRYWCYVAEQNDLGLSHYQWNYSYCPKDGWNSEDGTVTHWMPLPEPPMNTNH